MKILDKGRGWFYTMHMIDDLELIMNYANITILESDTLYEFSEVYDVYFSGTFIGSIRRYDYNFDEVLYEDRFFATPGADEDGGDDFATFGEALNYLLSENV